MIIQDNWDVWVMALPLPTNRMKRMGELSQPEASVNAAQFRQIITTFIITQRKINGNETLRHLHACAGPIYNFLKTDSGIFAHPCEESS